MGDGANALFTTPCLLVECRFCTKVLEQGALFQ